ncbi:MAG: aminotransferase class I/II-fold pyridoxal phosphate-dependent enzyme [Acidobacteriia bacterium]|nr:aminotransferase class I/II-fold pyridoxal phosphate-dependent enzyme [Terriglobia bacterium]
MNRSTIVSPYMEFSKLHSAARFNLAASGIMNYPLSDLPVTIDRLEIDGPDAYGYEPLIARLAAKSNVAPDCVVYVNGGTSLANHLAIAGTTEPGDHALIETPGYELLDTTARFLGLEIDHFERHFEDGYRLDPRDIERQLTPRTRLIVITNLHNPSGVLADNDTLRQIGNFARSAGARVLVDEVYLDMGFERTPPSSFHLDPKIFVVTSSLTKAYGLSGLRCGWILAEPELARRIWRINDVYGATPVHAAELLSVIALDNLPKIAARAKSLLQTNRALLNSFFDSCDELDVVRPEFGTVAFPRLRSGAAERLFNLLRDKYEASIVPGSFFGAPQHFRIGVGGETEMTREALVRLGRALQELS